MKKIVLLILLCAISYESIAVEPEPDGNKVVNANNILLPIGKTGKTISLADFSKLTPSEYEKLANAKLGFFNKIAYKRAMKKLRKSIATDGTITNKKLYKLIGKGDGTEGFNGEGFGLGFVLGILGVAIAYLAFRDDAKQNRIKWAWLGMAASIVLGAILLIILVSKIK